MFEVTKMVAVQSVQDAQALATIEATKITADATMNAGIVAAVFALVVAIFIGVRQIGIQQRQTDIQHSIAELERTKVAISVVDRRAEIINAIMVYLVEVKMLAFFVNGDGEFTDEAEVAFSGDFEEKYQAMRASYKQGRFYFSDEAKPFFDALLEINRQVNEIRHGSVAMVPKVFLDVSKKAAELNDKIGYYLIREAKIPNLVMRPVPRPRPQFHQRALGLVPAWVRRAKKGLTERLWSFFRRLKPE